MVGEGHHRMIKNGEAKPCHNDCSTRGTAGTNGGTGAAPSTRSSSTTATALRYRVKDSTPPEGKSRWKSSKSVEIVEHELSRALESLIAMSTLNRHIQKKTNQQQAPPSRRPALSKQATTTTSSISLHLFPSVRECNSAIAKLGDEREFLRALRLFGKMRQAAKLMTKLQMVPVPAPTLVTYSTLMSRFVKANKPRVALRLWKIMKNSDDMTDPVDVKACNILMNCYAKLADVKSAKGLLYDMETEYQNPNDGHPFPLPNLITYNTVLTACQNAGDIDTALEVFPRILSPDTLSYTALIATVGRRGSRTMGQYDPTPAFDLLDQMIESNVYANGKTFSALIDACGRCRRSDLALQGLRIMLRYKKSRQIQSLTDEVGAWTAAINACGRNERLDAAIRLFYTMPKFGIEPNIITCGSLVDSLLRAGRTAETLMVLKFMKKNGLPVTEVMYTSLLQRAEKLAHLERGTHHRNRQAKWYQLDDEEEEEENEVMEKENGKAIEIYTGLIESLSGKDNPQSNSKSLLLMKAFLLFQEMASTDIMIDMPCYHAILRVCAQARDVNRALDVLQQMMAQNLVPTDTTWKLLLWSSAQNPVTAETIWKRGMAYEGDRWIPSGQSLQSLLVSYQTAGKTAQIAKVYRDIVEQTDDMGMDRIVLSQIETSSKIMSIFYDACKIHEPKFAETISQLECLQFLPVRTTDYP